MTSKNTSSVNRRHFLKTSVLGSLTLAGGVGAFGYARWIEPNHLSVTRKKIVIPNFPPALNGLTIAQMTDFHYRPDSEDALMAEAVEVVNAARPDLIALTGDFISHEPQVFTPLMAHLSKLRAKHGIYGIMGNHDGWNAPYSLFQKGFQQAGFEFLINARTHIEINGERLSILGTDSIWSGQLDLPACYRGHHAGDPVIALVHEPDVFDQISDNYPVSLQLSGHTHGGQCRVPLIGYAPIKVKYGEKYIYGEYARKTDHGDARIFVSRGLGTVGAPVRFACPPEVAILTCING